MFVNFYNTGYGVPAGYQPNGSNNQNYGTTQALNENGGNNPPSYGTTQALNEGGGYEPQPTTRAAYETGGYEPKPIATTQAVGEEGGGIEPYPQPRPEPPKPQPYPQPEQPIYTTQAVGEAGGGIEPYPQPRPEPPKPQPYPQPEQPIYTTQAVGEEGGGIEPYPQPRPEPPKPQPYPEPTPMPPYPQPGGTTRARNEEGGTYNAAIRVKHAADTNKDGVMDQKELEQHAALLKRQLYMMQVQQNIPTAAEQQRMRGLQNRLNAANFMQKNFDVMSAADGKAGISGKDIRTTAQQDGNPWHLGNRDIELMQKPTVVKPEPPNPYQDIQKMMEQIMLLIRQMLGGQAYLPD